MTYQSRNYQPDVVSQDSGPIVVRSLRISASAPRCTVPDTPLISATTVLPASTLTEVQNKEYSNDSTFYNTASNLTYRRRTSRVVPSFIRFRFIQSCSALGVYRGVCTDPKLGVHLL